MSNVDISIIGMKFNKLTVVSFSHVKRYSNGNSNAYFNAVCDCGVEKCVLGNELKTGGTKSCGCLRFNTKHRLTHGDSGKRLYVIYKHMSARCNDVNIKSYKDYGGRGIKVCDEWSSYEAFRDWALNNGYEENLTIERKNVNGNYSPDNCTWITKPEQALNRRTTRWFEANGLRMCLSHWAKYLGVDRNVLKSLKTDEKILLKINNLLAV